MHLHGSICFSFYCSNLSFLSWPPWSSQMCRTSCIQRSVCLFASWILLLSDDGTSCTSQRPLELLYLDHTSLLLSAPSFWLGLLQCSPRTSDSFGTSLLVLHWPFALSVASPECHSHLEYGTSSKPLGHMDTWSSTLDEVFTCTRADLASPSIARRF